MNKLQACTPQYIFSLIKVKFNLLILVSYSTLYFKTKKGASVINLNTQVL